MSLLLMLYPSIPVTNFFSGENFLFFVLSLILIFFLVKKQDCYFSVTELVAIFLIFLYVINYFIINFIGSFNYRDIDFLFGLRWLITNFVILVTIRHLIIRTPEKKLIRMVIIGFLLNVVYCILEEFFQGVVLHDKFFHVSRSVERLSYLMNDESRNRMLWDEPSEAGVYLFIFILPLLYLWRDKLPKIKVICIIWVLVVLAVYSKGSLIFFAASIFIGGILSLKLNSKSIIIFFTLAFGFVLIQQMDGGNNYAVNIFKYLFSLDFVSHVWNEGVVGLLVGNEVVGSSQTVRFARIYSTILGGVNSPFYIPLGVGYMNIGSFLGALPDGVIPDVMFRLPDFTLDKYRLATQSSFLEVLVSFGFGFFVIVAYTLYKVSTFFIREKTLISKIIGVNVILQSMFMFTLHFSIMIIVLYYLIEKRKNSDSSG